MFSPRGLPRRSRVGMTWSRLSCFARQRARAQYWQVALSRSKTLLRVSFSSLQGKPVEKTVSRMTRGKPDGARGGPDGFLGARRAGLWWRKNRSNPTARRCGNRRRDDGRPGPWPRAQQPEGAPGADDIDRLPEAVSARGPVGRGGEFHTGAAVSEAAGRSVKGRGGVTIFTALARHFRRSVRRRRRSPREPMAPGARRRRRGQRRRRDECGGGVCLDPNRAEIFPTDGRR